MTTTVNVELGHKAFPKEKPTSDGYTHNWTVFVRGPDNSPIHFFIEKVVFHLHESFPKPKRVFKEPPYEISESGYGGFMMGIDVHFRNGARIRYEYDLYLGLNEAITNIRPEKVTFPNPSEEFRIKLLQGGGIGVLNTEESLMLPTFQDRQQSSINTVNNEKNLKRSPSNGYAGGKGVGNIQKIKDSLLVKNRPSKPDPFSELFGEPTSICFGKCDSKKEQLHVTSNSKSSISEDRHVNKKNKESRKSVHNIKTNNELIPAIKEQKVTKKKVSKTGPNENCEMKIHSEQSVQKAKQPEKKKVEKLLYNDVSDKLGKVKHNRKKMNSTVPNKNDKDNRSYDVKYLKQNQIADHVSKKKSVLEENVIKKSISDRMLNIGPPKNPLQVLEEELSESSSSSSEFSSYHSDMSSSPHQHSLQKNSPSSVPFVESTPHSKYRTKIRKTEAAKPRDRHNNRVTPEYLNELRELQKCIMNLTDGNLAQAVVDIIEDTGQFSLGTHSVDFDLYQMDASVIQKLKKCLNC